MKFTGSGLNDVLSKATKRSGFERATLIQEKTIPLTLADKDMTGQAQMGTDKTAIFGLSILQKINNKEYLIQVLVIEPTRELVVQTQRGLYRLGRDGEAKV